MKAVKRLLLGLIKDEQGGEVLEYAIVAGLIVVGALIFVQGVGTKVVGEWTDLNTSN